ncbi:MAG: mammalian cell entry protein [Mycobacterium sp.]
MSPRRKLEPLRVAEDEPVVESEPGTRRWGLPAAIGAAVVLVVAALVASVFLLQAHSDNYRQDRDGASLLAYVRHFMTQFTSPDPFNANGYADAIQAQATGDFATKFQERKIQLLVEVAISQPAAGTVSEAGVERWNADGSADLLVLTTISTTSPDGTQPVERWNRWSITAAREGDQWKISRLEEAL